MNKKIIVSLFTLIALIGVVLIIISNLSKPVYSGVECRIISENSPPEKAINIVFLTENLNEKAFQKYIKEFIETEPFNESKNKFNFYYISEKPKCELYKGIALFCYSRNLINLASSCPNDFIAVVSDRDRKIRSSAYMNVMSINYKLPPTVFLHEFGHVFANLADEYVPAQLRRGSKNCKKTCEEFEGIGKCYKGCSRENLFRSSYASIMKTLNSKEYGDYNTLLIKQKMEEWK